MIETESGAARLARFGLDRLPYEQCERRLSDLVDLTGTRALVTGGGGANLGQAIVHRLAGSGATVAVADVDGGAARRVAAAAAGRWGVTTWPVVGSTSDWDGAHRVVAEAEVRLGGIDVLVNNVGGGAGAFHTMSRQQMDDVIATTLLSTLYCSRAVLDRMVEAGKGCIVNISSEGADMAIPEIALYNACKSGVDRFTRNLAAEVGPFGVRVVGVAPGMMLGAGLVHSLQHPESAGARLAAMERSLSRISVGRACLPEEVANVVAFLVSDAAAHVHGTTVRVGGGMSS